MNDERELLELAALAAGRSIRWDGNVSVLLDYEPGVDDCSAWCPLTDDGDAARIAVKLDMEVRQVHGKAHAGYQGKMWQTVAHGKDKYAATRLAIIQAAAEIGRRLKAQTPQEPQ